MFKVAPTIKQHHKDEGCININKCILQGQEIVLNIRWNTLKELVNQITKAYLKPTHKLALKLMV